MTDETYSLVCDPSLPEGVERKHYYFWVSLMDQSYWVLGSFLGGLLGSAITFNTEGIDFAMTALFVVIVAEQWENTKMHIPAAVGVAVSLVCLFLFGPSNFLIPAMLGISVGLFLLKGMITKGDKSND